MSFLVLAHHGNATPEVHQQSGLMSQEMLNQWGALSKQSSLDWYWFHYQCQHSNQDIAPLLKHFSVDATAEVAIQQAVQSLSHVRWPVFQETSSGVFMQLHGLHLTQNTHPIKRVPLLIWYAKNTLITVSQEAIPCFEAFPRDLTNHVYDLKKGLPFLLSEILECLVEGHKDVLEELATALHHLELKIAHRAEQPAYATNENKIIHTFLALQRGFLKLHQYLEREQTVFYRLSHRDLVDLTPKAQIRLKEVDARLLHIVNQSDDYREILSGILTIYMSLTNNRMNEVMRLLTMVSAMLMPPTLIAGIYGMNFKFMPELQHPYGYYMALILMFLIWLAMVGYFKWKRWL
jgi:magnesium transporter